MDFSLKRWGAHFCPPPIWAAKKACFLPPFQVFGHVAHMFFRFLLHRFCVFLYEFCAFSHFFVKFSACAKRILADFGSNLLCFLIIIPCKFRRFSDLYDWYYPACPPGRAAVGLLGLRLYLKPANFKRIIQKKREKWWQFEKIIVNLQL